MKRLLLFIPLLLSGCCCYYGPPGMPAPSHPVTSQYTVVNGSGVTLDVYQDGRLLGPLHVGHVMPVYGTILWQRTVVTVVGRDAANGYAGTATWVFDWACPEAWTVLTLYQPQQF